MKTSELFKRDRPVFSFEVYPPRNIEAAGASKRVCATMEVLSEVHPDFVSVTYRGSGASAPQSDHRHRQNHQGPLPS
jgi:methylenetetrahydrofolate reductase (NADPH)|nr:methylenetetrahydrofolate reductase [Lacticaseibacillus songhuajiangensis]